MKNIVLILTFLIVNLFASNKESLINDIKSLIQKEEYLAIAINKYILQTGQIPKNTNNQLDIDLLKDGGYLDSNFNDINPFTNATIVVNFNTTTNNAFIVSLIDQEEKYRDEHKYLYDFYTNNNFRVNTLAPDISNEKSKKQKLVQGTQIIYDRVQKDIVDIITKNSVAIILENGTCQVNKYFYELANEKLTYKYCKTNQNDANNPIKITVYQESPIILDENLSVADLIHIKANIGDTAFVKKNNDWIEYYFHGETLVQGQRGSWSEKDKLKKEIIQNNQNTAEQIASYIPNAKDFYIRQGGGCYLANGDIYCWGKNNFKQAGINRGQMDNTINPDYVNIPVILKTQISDIKIDKTTYNINSERWYNSPYRVKFEKIGMNRTNVCGITKIIVNNSEKSGGELYCNGTLNSNYYEEVSSNLNVAIDTPILKRNIFINKSKSTGTNAIYLKDIAMIEDVIALLDDNGKIYTMGKNYKGSLGVGRNDGFFVQNDPTLISGTTKFKKIFALRDARTFGAISEADEFYMWGERESSWINKPTIISNITFNENKIFVNTAEFILGTSTNQYYKTKISGNNTIVEEIAGNINPRSVSYFKDDTGKEYMLYIDQSNILYPNTSYSNSQNLMECKESNENDCTQNDAKDLFDNLIKYLNEQTGDKKIDITNVSIYKLDHQIKEVFEDFENDYSGWNLKLIPYKDESNYYLGRFSTGTSTNNYLNKTFDFGIENKGKSVTIKFDFIQVGTWAKDECLHVYLNSNTQTTGQCMSSNNTSAKTYNITLTSTIDNNGKFKLGFSSNISSSSKQWGIDNLEFKIDNKSILKNDFEPKIDGWYQNNLSNSTLTAINDKFVALPDDGTTRLPATTHLGKFPINHTCSNSISSPCPSSLKDFIVSKTYDFSNYDGKNYQNYEVEIEFDFYEIDSWDGERFEFWVNGEKLAEDHFVKDNHESLLDSNISGVSLQRNIGNNQAENPQAYRYKLKSKIDNTGKLNLEFKTNLEFNGNVTNAAGRYDAQGNPIYGNRYSKFDEGIDNESWGIDNVRIKIKEPNKKFVCAMTGVEQSSQMYCWGNVARSLPILNTSLYDSDKIDSLNNLFFSQNQDINKQMSFDAYDKDKNGMLFLKYPTYIGGFDYPFYFK